MNLQDLALAAAGCVGGLAALIHGALVDRHLVHGRAAAAAAAGERRMSAVLLQFTTFNWFVGGAALVVVAVSSETSMRRAVGGLVALSYLYGALGNLWATRGRHPGWAIYGLALLLIAYALMGAEAHL